MGRRVLLACLAVGISLAAARPALAQGRFVGGGLGYTFDEREDFVVINGMAWIPVNGPDIVFKPIVLSPRVQFFPGLDMAQVHINALWDIPVARDLNVHPYMGLGVGLSHRPGETRPVFNFNAGFRYRKPEWKHQFAAEIHYSAGLKFGNTMVMNFTVLFPFGRS